MPMSVHCRLHSTRALEHMLTRLPRVDSLRLSRGTIGLLSTIVSELISKLLVLSGGSRGPTSVEILINYTTAPHRKIAQTHSSRLQHYINCLSCTLSNGSAAINLLYVITELSTAFRRISIQSSNLRNRTYRSQ